MQLVTFICPRCRHQAQAPLSAVAAGDAGIWVCDACGVAYQIQIEFASLTKPASDYDSPSASRGELPVGAC